MKFAFELEDSVKQFAVSNVGGRHGLLDSTVRRVEERTSFLPHYLGWDMDILSQCSWFSGLHTHAEFPH